MEVILKEDVAKLGSRGDVVKVAEGYGRNYLLPQKLAIEATSANRAVIEQMKAASVRRLAREKGDAEAIGKQLTGVELSFTRKTGEHDQLFGSVTSADIARELENKGVTIDRRKIQLDEPLKRHRRLQRSYQAAQGRRSRAGEGHDPGRKPAPNQRRAGRYGRRSQRRSVRINIKTALPTPGARRFAAVYNLAGCRGPSTPHSQPQRMLRSGLQRFS